ncbi:MAG: haloacid dehalogenase [Candidatus Hermodarchaeota archaeon]
MNLKKIFLYLTTELDELDLIREEILKVSRTIVRDCSIAIKNVHRREFKEYSEKVNEIQTNHNKLLSLIDINRGEFYKHLKTPEQEYSEAIVFHSIITNRDIPSPDELNIIPLNFALGMADVIGELRRYALDNIRNSQIEDLNQILELMDEIYSYLFSLDYPSGLTQDLRHKTDQARILIEKTRGDISISLQMNELKRCIESKPK